MPPKAIIPSINMEPPVLGDQRRSEEEKAERKENQQPDTTGWGVLSDDEVDGNEHAQQDAHFPEDLFGSVSEHAPRVYSTHVNTIQVAASVASPEERAGEQISAAGQPGAWFIIGG
jgi:hypothetical protein